jgi:hypothetical protein
MQNIDVTASLTAWLNDASPNRGWVILPTGTDGVDVRASEYVTAPTEGPKLSVTYTPPVIDLNPGDVIIAGFQASGSGEFIELFNTTDEEISLENMNLIARVDIDAGDGVVDEDWNLVVDQSPVLTGLSIQPNSFFLVGEAANPDLTTNMNLATGEGGLQERAISIELLIDDKHMDYVLYGRNDGSSPPGELPPGDIPFAGFDDAALVPAGSAWSYLDDGSDQTTAWKDPPFDDSTWAVGDAQLGYAEGDEATVVNCGPGAPACNVGGNFITTYFRHTFQVADAASVGSLTLWLLRDDGAIVYLNGTEVRRDNMPADPIDYLTLATSPAVGGTDEDTFFESSVDAGLLVDGDNVLAVEIHQQATTSSDISFDLGLIAHPLVAAGSEWRYLDNGSDQGTAWKEAAPPFDDSLWAMGNAELGYGDSDEATVISCGPSAPTCNANNIITTYFRHSFEIADSSAIDALVVRLRRDDGAIVYVNGTEVFRSNMPGGPIDYLTVSSTGIGGADETTFFAASVDPTLLVDGTNLIAVEVHQTSATSSDVSFDLELLVPRTEVIRTVSGDTTAFNEGVTQRVSALDLYAGHAVEGFYTDEGSLPGFFPVGVWTSQHSTSGGAPRDSTQAAVCEVGQPCDDGNACTTGDTCTDGVCIGGGALDCDDGNECTADSCDFASGCVNDPLTGNLCNDTLTCTINDVCTAGICVGQDDCAPGEACDPGTDTCIVQPTIGMFQEGLSGYAGTQDTFLREEGPGEVHGNDAEFEWDDDDTNGTNNRNLALIHFDNIFGNGPGQIPAGSQIVSATLSYTLFDQGVDADLREMLVDWDEADSLTSVCGASCDEGVEYGATTIGTASGALPLGTKVVDVTSSIQSWVNNPGANHGWVGVPPAPGPAGGGAQLRSSEYGVAAQRPMLAFLYLPCSEDIHCDDGSPCTVATCEVDGSCSYAPANEGAACDDDDSGTINDTCVAGACVGEPPECSSVAFAEDFDSFAVGTDPAGWIDTAANNSTSEQDNFDVQDIGGELAFGTTSSLTNIHSHYVTAESMAWSNYTLSARGLITTTSAGWGVTVLSGYPNDEAYYRLRRYRSRPTLYLVALGTDCVSPETGFTPVAGQWFRVKVQAEDDGTNTSIRAKAWPDDGTPEPLDWQAVCVDSNPSTRRTSGPIGVWSMGSGGHYWDELEVTSNSGASTDCDDGDLCNGVETCDAGVCVPGTPLACDDGNTCNGLETCDPVAGCQTGTPLDCSDTNVCTADSCDPASGCINDMLPEGTPCSDGDACNGAETCSVVGVCEAGPPLVCNDGNVCNGTETCDPTDGCQPGTTPIVCSDGDVCNGIETCDPIGGCQVGTPLVCDDNDACNGLDTCDPIDGCQTGPPVDCDDGDPCTADICDPGAGTCENTPIEDCEADLRILPVATLVDPATTPDTSSSALPTSVPYVPAGEPHWLEIWATDVGTTNDGISAAYVNVSFCGETVAETVDPGSVFTTLTSGTIGAGSVDEFGGSAPPDGDPSNDGIEPSWVRVGWIQMRADASMQACEIRVLPTGVDDRVAAFGRGLVPYRELRPGQRRFHRSRGPESVLRLPDRATWRSGPRLRL